jgi:hypothetical protein
VTPNRPKPFTLSPKLNPSAEGSAPLRPEAKYGLLGLLDVIRLTDRVSPLPSHVPLISPQDLNILALGSDLTTYGLNLNSSECLYASFASPFSDHSLSSEPQFTTPLCYQMHPPSLKPEHLSKFLVETLFYMFFAMPRDSFQASAAQELYRREWRWHAELRLWLKPRSPQEQMQSHPGVQYVYFDPSAWEARLFTNTTRTPLASGFLSGPSPALLLCPLIVSLLSSLFFGSQRRIFVASLSPPPVAPPYPLPQLTQVPKARLLRSEVLCAVEGIDSDDCLYATAMLSLPVPLSSPLVVLGPPSAAVILTHHHLTSCLCLSVLYSNNHPSLSEERSNICL